MAASSAELATTTWEPDDPDFVADRWFVTIVVHPSGRHVGRRVALAPDGPLVLGRECEAFGQAVLDDRHTSRQHAKIELVGDDGVDVHDLGSHNGTFVDGARVVSARVTDGSLVGVGRIVFAIERDVAGPAEPVALPGIVGNSGVWRRALGVATSLGRRGRPMLLAGEPGVGKATVVRAIHGAWRSGPFVDAAMDDAAGLASAIAAVGPGTLLVDGVERGSDDAWAAVLRVLDVAADRESPWIVLASRSGTPHAISALESAHLRAHLAGAVVQLPPVRRRKGDLAELIGVVARRFAGDDVQIEPRLAVALLRHRWPGNVRELESIIERAAIESPEPTRLVAFRGLDALLGGIPPTEGATMDPVAAPFVVGADGLSFTTPAGEAVDLASRKVLARVLASLLDAHRVAPGQPVGVARLLEAAWPGERVSPKAGANRVYVALTTLRRLGLRELIARIDGGYMVAPGAALHVIAAPTDAGDVD